MYIYIYIYIHIFIYVYLYIYTYIHVYKYTYIHIYVHMKTYNVHKYKYMHICTYIHIYIHVFTYIHICGYVVQSAFNAGRWAETRKGRPWTTSCLHSAMSIFFDLAFLGQMGGLSFPTRLCAPGVKPSCFRPKEHGGPPRKWSQNGTSILGGSLSVFCDDGQITWSIASKMKQHCQHSTSNSITRWELKV